jgi:hypothetical protein
VSKAGHWINGHRIVMASVAHLWTILASRFSPCGVARQPPQYREHLHRELPSVFQMNLPTFFFR